MSLICLVLFAVAPLPFLQDPLSKPIAEDWEFGTAMRQAVAGSKARPGVVLHVGDSITYANPYSQWARNGAGRTASDLDVLKWMHAGAEDDTDGWHLARFDHPDGGRSHTACSGLRVDELLAGGRNGLPSLAAMIEKYRPAIVVLLIGTNDVTAGRNVAEFQRDFDRAVETILGAKAIPIVTTLPPQPAKYEAAREFSAAIREVARKRNLPLIDYEREILARRPNDWNGTLMAAGDVHPSAEYGDSTPISEPTPRNLRNSGYLLRSWLTVRKIAEVKAKALDGVVAETAAIRLPVTRDNWFSSVDSEVDGNNGANPRLKVKSYQEMSILDFDPAPIRGKRVKSAVLHVRPVGGEMLRRITTSTVAAEWEEGTGTSYSKVPGASTFAHQRHPSTPWTEDGGDLCSVILSQGGTIWGMADATPPDANGWQTIPVDPRVIEARAAGLSYGVLIFDDTGSQWSRNGEKFELWHFPNRFTYSREAGKDRAPYFTVELEDAPGAPLGPPDLLGNRSDDLPAGEASLFWTMPASTSDGVLGFDVLVDDKPVPRWRIPRPDRRDTRRFLHLSGLSDGMHSLAVRTVDRAGKRSEYVRSDFKPSSRPVWDLPGTSPTFDREAAPLPKLGDAEVAIVDELDKVHPVSGEMIPSQPADYLFSNHLWNARANRVQLFSGRNEFVGFQIVLRGNFDVSSASLKFASAPDVRTTFRRYRTVASKSGPLPDPLVPLDEPMEAVAGRKFQSLHADVYVPHETKAGELRGVLTLSSAGAKLEIPVLLKVWDFTLPNRLSFLQEMNGYGLPADERGYYRLGHEHRTVVNIVPYSQSGKVAKGWAPEWKDGQFAWTAFDRRFGPYFSGEAFADLPRKSVPLECFYLPLHENWPLPMEGNYNGDYWADRAFPMEYRQTFVEASRKFAEHFNAKGWKGTLFQGFLNNKMDFKKNGWSRGSSPWILDEPASFQDFWALRYFGSAFHEGVKNSEGPRMAFRADVSRPMWQRDSLDGLLDYNVVSSSFRKYRRMVLERKSREKQIVVEYGTPNAIEESNLQAVAWSIDAWSLGADGVLPWLTIGEQDAWKAAQPTSLFYPPRESESTPTPSIRLKAYRRGQQDVEYLTLLYKSAKRERWEVADAVRKVLPLAGKRKGTGFAGGEDAGKVVYDSLRPADLWALRVRIGEAVSAMHPEPKDMLVSFKPTNRRPEFLENRMVGGERAKHPASKSTKLTPHRLQGPKVVRDVLIDFERPDQNLQSLTRDVAIKKGDRSNALLVRFDVPSLKLQENVDVERAELSFFVWDPSSQGRTKVKAFPLVTKWSPESATWRNPSAGKSWKGGREFNLADDARSTEDFVIVESDQASDTVDPPLEYRIDVTSTFNEWRRGTSPNHGFAISAVPDRSIDEGFRTRFQVYSTKHADGRYGPKLTVWVRTK